MKEVDIMNTNEKKMTIRDYYTELRELAETADRPDLVEFIDGRVIQLDKKNKSGGEKKQTALQIANEGYKVEIYDYMVTNGGSYKVGELIKAIPICKELNMSSSKVTSMLRQLRDSGKVVMTANKGANYWSAV